MIPRIVLIETLWNVKFYNLEVSCLSASINRNIVECKDNGTWKGLYYLNNVLIETLWNVKR